MVEKVNYILVHGAGLGGWCWDKVRRLMEARGASVYAPTIPEASLSLENSIEYVVGIIESKNLQNCILVGHSYGGMIITGVADRLESKINRVIFLDAAVPKDGDDFASHIPGISKEHAEKRRQAFRSFSSDGIWIAPIAPELAGISDVEDIDYVNKHSRPHPLASWLEPIKLRNDGIRKLPKTYIMATDPPTDIMGYPVHGEIAKSSVEWIYQEISCGHAAMIIRPEEITNLLLE